MRVREGEKEEMAAFPTRILLATDGSRAAKRAAQRAVELANSTSSELHAVFVEEVPVMAETYAVPSTDRPETEEGRRLLDEQVKQLEEAGASVEEAHLRTGRPAREIIELSEEIGADLIVLGNRGLTEMERLVLGSVSEAVVRYASRSVLVVRQEED